ncbi:hypothetical protein D3C81_1069800 [compost metagenome]
MVLILSDRVVTYIPLIPHPAKVDPHIKFVNQAFYNLISSPGIAVYRKVVIDVFIEVCICQCTLNIRSIASSGKTSAAVGIVER